MADSSIGDGPAHVVLVVSDGTGVTAERVVRAALTQFDPAAARIERMAEVREIERIDAAVAEAARRRATIVHSLVSPAHRRRLLDQARLHHVATIDILGPILGRLSEVLETSPHAQPGLFHQLDEEYFRRTEAIAYAVQHDDGRMVEGIGSADVVLVGVSRTTKTPLSMLLAYRSWRVANIPIVLGIEPPEGLYEIPREKVIALAAQTSWLQAIRMERARRMTRDAKIAYALPEHIREELAWFRRIVARGGWQTVDVTRKAIEETAAEIVDLLRRPPR